MPASSPIGIVFGSLTPPEHLALGLASVMTRHPAVLAMELAGLARMHPGRVRATLGPGNRHWLARMGLLPDRPLEHAGFPAPRA